MAETLHGQCLCGAVKYHVTAAPIWSAHCHCSMCRRAHGAPFVTWVGVPLDAFKVMEEEPSLRWYASSAQAKRGFCSACGTPLFFHGEKWADEMHIARATFVTRISLLPEAHVYYDTHVDWIQCNDHLPRYDEHGKPMPNPA
jgi:hypothetical protein